MIMPEEYAARRRILMDHFEGSGNVIFLEGGKEVDRNPDVPYPFWQKSFFQYLTGISNLPDCSIALLPDKGEYILFAPKKTVDDEVWDGPSLSHDQLKTKYHADEVLTPEGIGKFKAMFNDNNIISLPGYGEPAGTMSNPSKELASKLIDMRLIKSPAEIANIEKALDITKVTYEIAWHMIKPGVSEADIQADMEKAYMSYLTSSAFPPIVTIDGNALHNFKTFTGIKTSKFNNLKRGRLVLIDSGATYDGYSADITRVYPVSGKFTDIQKDIYEIVLEAKNVATELIKPGFNYKLVHDAAELVIAQGLRDVGVLKGSVTDIIENGAHRKFFVHGLGHALGLDDHDCGDFKDLSAGYTADNPRSDKFGLKSLRFARNLEPGHIVTVEPGVYFISGILNTESYYSPHKDFINLDFARSLINKVSGIRLEDDILVTKDGYRVLGPGIPIRVEEVEKHHYTTV